MEIEWEEKRASERGNRADRLERSVFISSPSRFCLIFVPFAFFVVKSKSPNRVVSPGGRS